MVMWNTWLGAILILAGLASAIVGGSFLTSNRQPDQKKDAWMYCLLWGGLIAIAIGFLFAFWPSGRTSTVVV